jgi:hypothetical protein
MNANQGMPVRLRLIAPNFKYHNTAGASLRSLVSKTLRARGSTETPCHGPGARAQGCPAHNLCSERYRAGPPLFMRQSGSSDPSCL